MGPLRVLVNSAGIGWAQRTVGKDGTLESAANLDAFKKVVAINLIGSFDCIRVAGTAMSTTEPLDDGEMTRLIYLKTRRRLADFPPMRKRTTLVVHVGPGNTRALIRQFDTPRGPIVTADGVVRSFDRG